MESCTLLERAIVNGKLGRVIKFLSTKKVEKKYLDCILVAICNLVKDDVKGVVNSGDVMACTVLCCNAYEWTEDSSHPSVVNYLRALYHIIKYLLKHVSIKFPL